MKPARYIFVNRGLGMTPGKIAAQAAHAETLAMYDYMIHDSIVRSPPKFVDSKSGDVKIWMTRQVALFSVWFGDGHYTKYVMLAEDSEQMRTIETYLNERNFKTYLVIDEGHTEGTYMVPTAMSVELVDKDDRRVTSIFSTFKIYKEPRVLSEAEEQILDDSRINVAGVFLRAIRRK